MPTPPTSRMPTHTSGRSSPTNNVPAGSVRWVFAPNGYSLPADPFEEYYPGDAVTDVIGFSSYNYGFYPGYGTRWDDPSFTFGNYLPQTAGHDINPPDHLQSDRDDGDHADWAR